MISPSAKRSPGRSAPLWQAIGLLWVVSVGNAETTLPLFDAHLHYRVEDAAHLSAEQIIATLDRNRVVGALVSIRPHPELERLAQLAPERIALFLDVYRTRMAKRYWMRDLNLPARIERRLDEANGRYRGIGELHLFAADAESPVLAALAQLAVERDLLLLVHGDREVVEQLFVQQPKLTLLWAHLGTDPRPQALSPMLRRYPNLYLDTSVRDDRFVDDAGQLSTQWRNFFIEHAERVLVGVDTHWTPRWYRFDRVATAIRSWLAQLPQEVAEQIAYKNGERLLSPAREN